MSPCDILETISGGFAIYGLMWVIIFFLLYFSHLARYASQTETKNPNKTGSGPTSGSPKTLGPVPAIPGVLFTQLNNGYNSATIPFITQIVTELNTALHYASEGTDSFEKIMNNSPLVPSNPDLKHIHNVSKQFYSTFLNSKNPFANPVPTNTIQQWANTILTNPDFTSFSQINPTSQLATKLQGNLKTDIERFLDSIKKQNPVTP